MDEGMVVLNEAGRMVESLWLAISERYPAIALDLHVVMPDHLHGLISISGDHQERPKLGRVVQWFKTWTTNQYIDGVKSNGWTPFEGKLWQTGYCDHIGRGDADLERIRTYILKNPERRWQKMREDSSDRG